MSKMSKKANRQQRTRSGAALVELAVCMPAIVALTMGTIEATTMLFLKQSLTVCAYEGMRQAIDNDATSASVVERCNVILEERRIVGATITLTPNSLEGLSGGDDIAIRVEAPVRSNSVLQLRFFTGSVNAEISMVKE